MNREKTNIFEGTTRITLMEIAKDLGIDYSIGPITKNEFFQASEAFFQEPLLRLFQLFV